MIYSEKYKPRISKSPLVEYANFSNGLSIYLIRLYKPYSNGYSWAVVNHFNSNEKMYAFSKTREEAEEFFNSNVNFWIKHKPLLKRGFTGN